MSRSRHALMLSHADAEILRLRAENADLSERLHLLTDQCLARAGAINQPTFRKAPVPQQSAASMITSAIGITEIETVKKGPHGPTL